MDSVYGLCKQCYIQQINLLLIFLSFQCKEQIQQDPHRRAMEVVTQVVTNVIPLEQLN